MIHRNPRAPWLRPLILLATSLLAFSAMLIGQQFETVSVVVGEPSPETFVADSELVVPDQAATTDLRLAAVEAVEPIFQRDSGVDTLVFEDIQALFDSVRAGTVVIDALPLPEVTTTTVAEQGEESEATTSTVAPTEGDDATTTTVVTTTTPDPDIVRTSALSGSLYIDTDLDGVFTAGVDHGLSAVRLIAYDSSGFESETLTSAEGTYTISGLASGETTLLIDTSTVPDRLTLDTDLLLRIVDLQEDAETTIEALPMTIVIVPTESQELKIELSGRLLSPTTVSVLVEIASEDVLREILGKESWLASVESTTGNRAAEALSNNGGIAADELDEAKKAVATSSAFLPLQDAPPELLQPLSRVVTEIAAEFLQANKTVDEAATQAAKTSASAAVEDVMVTIAAGTPIVTQGTEITQFHRDALELAGLLTRAAPRYLALAAVVTLVVLMLSFYLGRFRPIVWNSMRKMALFGMLLALAALAARFIGVFSVDDPARGYLLPAAAFGLMAAILFDARIAVLMSMAVGSMTAIATLDPGLTLFATLATLAPVPFVSSISARRELRVAVFYMILILGALAGGVSWFFIDGQTAQTAVLYGALNGLLSGLIGSALLSFFEIIFDVTTSLRLLDLTDRNHPGLRLLEDKAIGTFNHSLMVGTLADQAARAVDANALLARAAAYYHDLGKTENPQFFIENQFGIQNPHDRMPPEESANVIRQHVIDGRRLARQFRIPADIAEGVETHHGDGIMHFFYGKAVERYGEEQVDIEDYRHVGRKPTTKEMAIIMMADSVEGACRAIFQVEEPSPERIAEVVERVVGEKVVDGQLSECSLTLGDLTKAKAAMVDALIGYYHQRIPYPNFPTPGAIEGGDDDSEEDSSLRETSIRPTVEQ